MTEYGGTIVVDRDGTRNLPAKVNGHARPQVIEYLLNANQQRRAQSGYDALRDSTEYEKTWTNADFLSADALNSKSNRHKAMKYSRYECESNAYYDGILSGECNLLMGVGPQLRVLGRNREFNQLVEREFYRWAQEVDLYRKLWCMTHARVQDGEAFAVMVNNPELRNRVQLDLVLIEAEQVQTPFIPFNERGYTDGIRFDPNNPHNILWYDVLREHPGGPFVLVQDDPIRVNPRDMLHWFKPTRPGQHRGMPALLSALNVGVSARRMKEATLAAAETAADLNVVATTQLTPDTVSDPMAPFSTIPIQKRMLTVGPMGWDLKHFQSEHPNSEYASFMRTLHAEMGRPIHDPVNLVEGDSSQYSFASGKLDMLNKFLALDVERQDCNVAVLDRVFAAWFRLWTVLTERRDIPPNHQWDWPAHPIIDIEADARAKDTQLKNGSLSLREYHSKAGRDYEDELAVQAEDAFGTVEDEASREDSISRMRKINVLRNTPAQALPYVAQLLGLKIESPQESQSEERLLVAAALSALATKHQPAAASEGQPINVHTYLTVPERQTTVQPPNVVVHPPQITIPPTVVPPAPDVNIGQTTIDVHMPEQKQPLVNVSSPVTVQVPEQLPPNVTVEATQVDVHIPEQRLPEITVPVNVQVPEQAPPNITVEAAQIHVPPQPAPEVTVTSPVTVLVPEQAPANITVASPAVNVESPTVNVAAPQVDVHVPEQKEFDLVPERDAKTGLVKKFKRVPKKG